MSELILLSPQDMQGLYGLNSVHMDLLDNEVPVVRGEVIEDSLIRCGRLWAAASKIATGDCEVVYLDERDADLLKRARVFISEEVES